MSGWFFSAMEATWPPARRWQVGPFALRDGAGGGKRVSAATAEGAWDDAALDAAEAAMDAPLFLIRPGEEALDAALAARGHALVDPVIAYAAPVARLQGDLPFLTAFPHWPPLAAAAALWAEGGIGPERLAVMDRVTGPKAAILGRVDDRPAGMAFVACADGATGREAMVHAVEVDPAQRRKGLGGHLLRAAANWAAETGAERLSLVVTKRNDAARALYDRLGMEPVAAYHYRARR